MSGILSRLAVALPEYRYERDAEILSRIDVLSKSIEGVGQELNLQLKALAEQNRNYQTPPADGNDQDDVFARQYHASIAEKLDYVELLGVDIHRYARRAKLSVAFIQLEVDVEDEFLDSSVLSHNCEDLIAGLAPDTPRLLILGEAGSGKSTLLRWMALAASPPAAPGKAVIDDGTDSLPASWRQRVPLLLRLRDLEAQDLPDPDVWPALLDESLDAVCQTAG